LRPILNFAPGGEVVPQGWIYPLGVKLSVRPSILLNYTDCSPLCVNKGVNVRPRGQISPLGAKFTPMCEVHSWEPRVKLRMALRFSLETAASVL
jgi:hypothetical protein